MMLPKTIAATCKPTDHAPITVALAYDGDAAFRAARELYLGVIRLLPDEFGFRDFWWRFDMLAQRALFERAVGIAAEADLVFCCPSNPQVLPHTVQNWIWHWLRRRKRSDGALVILFPVAAGAPLSQTRLERDLRETARASGLAFFATNYWADHAPTGLRNNSVAGRPNEHGTGVQRWGLNE